MPFEIKTVNNVQGIYLGSLRVAIVDDNSTHSLVAASALVVVANEGVEYNGLPAEAAELLEAYTR